MIKTGTKFIVRNTGQHVAEHTEKASIYLRQKQSSNIQPMRGEWAQAIPSNEEHTREVV